MSQPPDEPTDSPPAEAPGVPEAPPAAPVEESADTLPKEHPAPDVLIEEQTTTGPHASPPPAPEHPPAEGLRVEPPRTFWRRAWDRLPAGLRAHFALLATDRQTLFTTVVAAAVLTISRYHCSTGEYHRLATAEISQKGGLFAYPFAVWNLPRVAKFVEACTGPIAEYVYWFVGSLLLFYGVPRLLARVAKVDWGELGTGLGDWRYGLRATAVLYGIMLPFVVGASFTGAFSSHYPMAGGAQTSVRSLVTYELAYASYFIGWEFVYRGMLCVGLYKRWGAAALLLQAIPFAVMHAGKPEAEAYGSILAALALGVVAVRARSFWYGALLHAVIAFTMDMLALGQTHRFPKVW